MRSLLFRSLAVAMLLLAAFSMHGGLQAAPKAFTFSEPNGAGDVTGEGNDFFSRVIGDPLDFDNPTDVVAPLGFSNISMSGGVWRGTSTQIDARLFLLFPGYNVGATGFTTRSGKNYPIATSQYSHLIVKYRASAATNVVAYWMPAGDPFTAPIGNSAIVPVAAGDNIVDIDLAGTGGGAAWTSRSTWGALALDPAQFNNGVTVELDWARLVPASDAPKQPAAWSCPDCAGANIDLIADTNNNSADGGFITLANAVGSGAGSFQAPVGKLHPGQYYLGARRAGQATVYSPGKFTVQQSAILTINSPSASSGEDFATTVLGHAWDMTSVAPVAGTTNIANVSIANGVLQGNATNADPVVFLLNNNGPAIDANKYKFLTFSLFVQAPPATPPNNFAVVRSLWGNNPSNLGTSADIINWYNSWESYAYDMSTIQRLANTPAWSGSVGELRIDPHESPVAPSFKLGPVHLTALPQTYQGQRFAVTWQSPANPGTVSIFRDSARNNSGTLIAANVPVSAGGYVWSVPANTPIGTYWIRIVANDGKTQTSWYSQTQLKIGARVTSFTDVPSTNPFFTFIQDLLQRGIVGPNSNGAFGWQFNATRGSLAHWVVLARGWDFDLTGAPHFADVPPSDPDYAYIETAYNHNVLSGYNDAAHCGSASFCFLPNTSLTRGQMSKMVVNAFGWTIDTSGGPHFQDVLTSNPFYGQIETIFNRGAVAGYNLPGGGLEFRWGAPLTRGQLAKVLSNAIGQ